MSGFLDEEGSHGFADDVPAAQDDDFRAFDPDSGSDEQLVYACRCAGNKAGGVTQDQFADVDRMKTVHVLLR